MLAPPSCPCLPVRLLPACQRSRTKTVVTCRQIVPHFSQPNSANGTRLGCSRALPQRWKVPLGCHLPRASSSAHGTCAVGKVCSLVTKPCGSRPWCCHPGKAPREAVGRVFGTELKGLRGTRDFANNPAATENPERVRKQGIGKSADVVSMHAACTLQKTAIVSTGERFCRPLQALCTVARLPSRATGCSTATAPFG